jgi:hypothetical protein
MRHNAMADDDDDLEFITIDEACAIIGGKSKPINRSSYYRGVKAGRYEPPTKVGPNTSRVRLGRLRKRLLANIESAGA